MSGADALSVRVQNSGGLALEVLTLRCAGDCADIEAVPHGGNPPYTFRWEDGSMDAKRRVCFEANGILTVAVTDSASTTSEVGNLAQTKTASVRAEVHGCSMSDAGGAFVDGGPDASTGFDPDAGHSGMCMSGMAVDGSGDCQELSPIECGDLTPTHLSYALNSDLSPGKALCMRMSDFGLFRPVALMVSGGVNACVQTELLAPGEVTLTPEQLLAPGSVVCLQAMNGTYRHVTIGLLAGASGDVSRIKFEECERCPSAR